jgi:hypothetical protein
MYLPGFTADAALETVASDSSRPAVSEAHAVVLQQINLNSLTSRGASISRTPTLSGCFDIDYVPVCRGNPATPFGRCCDTTHERVCNGHRVAICTFTDCTGFPDTNTSVLT